MFSGSRLLRVRDVEHALEFPVLVMYPTATPSHTVRFGPHAFDVSIDADIAPGRYPLVIVSHGTGGSHLIYHTIATFLAQRGYVVALLEHPGNNRNDNRLEGTEANLEYRPRHVRTTIDAAAHDAAFAPHVNAELTAVIGHSLGGYTALAVAGGQPYAQIDRPVHVVADARVRALVLLAPATPWFLTIGSLANVRAPILMLTGEKDQITPKWHAELVLNGVADAQRVTWREVANAGHFSFSSPFPPALRSPAFAPSTDPEGFDREQFHRELPGEVLAFLDRELTQQHTA